VLPAPCYVFSDAHLGVAEPHLERALLSFLRTMAGRAGSLVVNGDLFDFWFEWRAVMPRRGFRVLAALAELRERGIPVLYIAGNHDCWGGEILREDVGVDFHVGPWTGSLGGWRARLEHGDGLRVKEDRPYRALRRVLRHPWSVKAFRTLHPDLASRVALGSSHTSRAMRPGDGGRGLRAVAADTLQRDPALELLIYGHSHVRALERVAGGGVYANPGAWLQEPTYLRVDEDRVELLRWNGLTSEGERLDVLERRAQEVRGHARELLSGVGDDVSALGQPFA
jgi:UDP-2,3-diacylglucosamine hydrolase